MMYDNRVSGFPMNFLFTDYRNPYSINQKEKSSFRQPKSTYSAIDWPEYHGVGGSSYRMSSYPLF